MRCRWVCGEEKGREAGVEAWSRRSLVLVWRASVAPRAPEAAESSARSDDVPPADERPQGAQVAGGVPLGCGGNTAKPLVH